MPWSPFDAQRHTRGADTPEKQTKWATVANDVLKQSGDEGKAIRVANAALAGTINHPVAARSKLAGVTRVKG